MKVWAHAHLTKLRAGERNLISVKTSGQKVEYTSWIFLENAEFRVFQPGRKRTIDTGVRNVHAWVVGEELERQGNVPGSVRPPRWRQAVYDPWKGETFVDIDTLEPVLTANYVILSGKDVYFKD